VRNLITDVPGMLVGNAQDTRAATGVTVAVFETSVVASVATLGGAPGDRATTLLEPEMTRGTRGVYEATALPYKTAVPNWKTRFGGGLR
jgi:L-aminopeptidase/D-esterase-like protein